MAFWYESLALWMWCKTLPSGHHTLQYFVWMSKVFDILALMPGSLVDPILVHVSMYMVIMTWLGNCLKTKLAGCQCVLWNTRCVWLMHYIDGLNAAVTTHCLFLCWITIWVLNHIQCQLSNPLCSLSCSIGSCFHFLQKHVVFCVKWVFPVYILFVVLSYFLAASVWKFCEHFYVRHFWNTSCGICM